MPLPSQNCRLARSRRMLLGLMLATPMSSLVMHASVQAQFGGGGGGMGAGAGQPGAGGAPGPNDRPKFREHVHEYDGIAVRREQGDAIVLGVQVIGNKTVTTHRILQKVQTRKDRFYDYETVLGDVRRLNDMGSFDHVTFKQNEQPGGVFVTFIVHERPSISQVIYHGNRAINDRELKGRAGVNAADPLSQFAIESAVRRLMDYYHEEGFNQAAISSNIGIESDPSAVIFRINEGPKERINRIDIEGSTIVSEARLRKIIKSRGSFLGIYPYANNTADLEKINRDVDVLAAYYHNLGFLTAKVGRRLDYDDTGSMIDLTFVVDEGPRFKINDVKILGNKFVDVESIRRRLELKPGDMFDGTLLRRDVGEVIYGYGELGFIYAEVKPQTVMRDEANVVDLVYKISEGDRWKVGEIRVNIDGEPHLMKETTMLNLVDLREGDWIDRRKLETNRSRLERSQLLETNPQIAEMPDIKVVPTDEAMEDY